MVWRLLRRAIDLATNKLSALVGRTEPRDWIDVITPIRPVQPFVYLLSAALESGQVVFHEGRICGAWPQIVE